MITGRHIAETAENSGLVGTPYSKLDCQALVEEVLKKAGLHIPNYRGSNHMWRELVYDRAKVKGADVPAGALAFIVRYDGGEVKRGYRDDMGNATHVAIALGNGKVFESTTGGVQYGNISRFTDYGLIHDVDYDAKGGSSDAGERCPEKVENLKQMIAVLKDNVEGLEMLVNDLYRST